MSVSLRGFYNEPKIAASPGKSPSNTQFLNVSAHLLLLSLD